ncbi:MAG TPA: DUF4041 domain-containing protein [Trueperaceae bacterium]|nr:DUF4041 domain-containing protein [Trueperaceae bacterium]
MSQDSRTRRVPLFGARRFARGLLQEIDELNKKARDRDNRLRELGVLSVAELEQRRGILERDLVDLKGRIATEQQKAAEAAEDARRQLENVRQAITATEELALLQEVGVYEFRHPLSDAVAYQAALADIGRRVKEMVRKDGGAIQASSDWTVNGSATQGRAMVREYSRLMLRAFNSEADSLVRGLKPYKLSGAVERLTKTAATIERLGKTMNIRIADTFLRLRIRELELTADYLEKVAVEKAEERTEKERLREERKAQLEMERERQKLEKERQHFQNALVALSSTGDEEAIARLREQLADVDRAIADVDYRRANIRAGYVYVISNIGSFGETMVKIGMTRRLDPMERIKELGDASVPFNFDVHALFFSKDAVGIENQLHTRLASTRVNLINLRREFFRVTPMDVKTHLAELAGELLQFEDVPEAVEHRQSQNLRALSVPGS